MVTRYPTLFKHVSKPCANCQGEGLLPGNDRNGLPKLCKACAGEGFYLDRVPVQLSEVRRVAA